MWDANTGTCLRTLTGHDYLVRALSFDPRSGRLVSGSYDKTVKVWDLHSGKMVREFRGCHASHIFDVKFDHCRIVRCVPSWVAGSGLAGWLTYVVLCDIVLRTTGRLSCSISPRVWIRRCLSDADPDGDDDDAGRPSVMARIAVNVVRSGASVYV